VNLPLFLLSKYKAGDILFAVGLGAGIEKNLSPILIFQKQKENNTKN
jgi:hypothetical protein